VADARCRIEHCVVGLAPGLDLVQRKGEHTQAIPAAPSSSSVPEDLQVV